MMRAIFDGWRGGFAEARPLAVTAVFIVTVAGLSGCSTKPASVDAGASEPPSRPERGGPDGDAAAAEPVARQLASARRLRAEGRLAEAGAQVEQALRMAPRCARCYRALMKVRRAQGRPREAEQLGLRAVTLVPAKAERARLWSAVARLRAAQGNAAGAEKARARAKALGVAR